MNRTMALPSVGRSLLAVLLAVTVALAVVLIAAAPKKADAATRIITREFSNHNEILIPEGHPPFGTTTVGPAAPYPSKISPSFPRGSKVRDVNVVLWDFGFDDVPDDVDVLLVHRGANRTIMSDVGGDNDVENINIKLDDEATAFLTDAGTLTGGRFKPTNMEGSDNFPDPAPPDSSRTRLSGFDGLLANGRWKLFVVDDKSADYGEIEAGWSVRVQVAVPQ
jgi:hypothetical protein